MKRVRTFLSYKGFQWEPIPGFENRTDPWMDFLAKRKGEACVCGSLITMGVEQLLDGQPSKVGDCPQGKAELQNKLAHQLKHSARRLHAAANPTLPKMVIIVNHEPVLDNDDFGGAMSLTSIPADLPVHLIVWFDDHHADRLLFNQSDRILFERMYGWFQPM